MSDSKASTETSASPAQVWSVLADGFRYAEWVHGTKEIREVDPGWPEVGRAIHYTAGVGPLTHKSETVVLSSVLEQLLELEIQAWPLGTIRVEITIAPQGDGSLVTLDEHPLRGLVGALHNTLTAVGFLARTTLMISDLVALAEAETDPSA